MTENSHELQIVIQLDLAAAMLGSDSSLPFNK